jgi:hypothetical protein
MEMIPKSFDLHDFIHYKWGSQKPYHKQSRIEKEYVDLLSKNMINKSSKRVKDIKKRIQNDLEKGNFTKKYQISSRYEYHIINDFCKTLNMKGYELYWCCSGNGSMKNKLDRIIEGNYFCCRDCDQPMTFVNKKVPVMYCYLSKVI